MGNAKPAEYLRANQPLHHSAALRQQFEPIHRSHCWRLAGSDTLVALQHRLPWEKGVPLLAAVELEGQTRKVRPTLHEDSDELEHLGCITDVIWISVRVVLAQRLS